MTRSCVLIKRTSNILVLFLLTENSTREDLDKLELASQDQSGFLKVLKRCKDTSELSAECICRSEVCISWYPCKLKLCQGEDDNGQPVEYRCGIKTCGKCHDFDFYVQERRNCFWDMNTQPHLAQYCTHIKSFYINLFTTFLLRGILSPSTVYNRTFWQVEKKTGVRGV